jgi:hypothetical protein
LRREILIIVSCICLISAICYGLKIGLLTLRYGGFEQAFKPKLSKVHNWNYIGGGLSAAPTAAAEPINSSKNNIAHLQVFTRGTDMYALRYVSLNGSKWSHWNSVAGLPISSSPSAVVLNNNTTDVFVRGPDNALWYVSLNGSKWSHWNSVAGLPISSSPSAVVLNNNTTDVFVRGPDNALWYVSLNGSKWSHWNYIGGGLSAAPTAAAEPINSSKNNIAHFQRGD